MAPFTHIPSPVGQNHRCLLVKSCQVIGEGEQVLNMITFSCQKQSFFWDCYFLNSSKSNTNVLNTLVGQWLIESQPISRPNPLLASSEMWHISAVGGTFAQASGQKIHCVDPGPYGVETYAAGVGTMRIWPSINGDFTRNYISGFL